MVKKFRLSLTAVLVFAVVGGFIQFLEADRQNYHTSLFGSLSASFNLYHNVKPSTIRFIPKNAQKITIISADEESELQKTLNNRRLTLTTKLASFEENYETVLYLKSHKEALTSHEIIEQIRNILSQRDQKIRISDFDAFTDTAEVNPYFQTTTSSGKFIDYKTILEDSDIILWIGQ